MKNTAVKIATILLMITLLFGCLDGRELSELEIVIGIGIDSADDPDSIKLTAQVVNVSQLGLSGSGGDPDSKPYWNAATTGTTIFEAIRQITHKTGNRLFVPHCEVVIYSKDVAKQGLYKHLDFFLRAIEMRLTSFILIAEGKAGEVLDAKPQTEELPAVNIYNLVKSYGFTSHLYDVTLKEFSSRLISEATAPVAPLIKVVQEGENKDVQVMGLAVFKEDKMIDELNMDETRGLLWVINEVKSGVLILPTPEESGVAVFEIETAKGKVKPEITDDGKIIMHIDIKLQANLSEQTTAEKLARPEIFEKLQDNMSEVVVQEIMSAYEKSSKTGSDIFGFGDMIHKKYNKKWHEQLEEDWEEIYKTIEFDIKVDSKITKTNLLKNPVTQKLGG